MDDIEKIQRRLLRAAETNQQRPAKRPRPARESKAERLYCHCLAVLTPDGACPKCELGRDDYQTFCRNCLRIHAVATRCARWVPSTVTLVPVAELQIDADRVRANLELLNRERLSVPDYRPLSVEDA